MTEFTINRENWATGSNGYKYNNHLLNDDGSMCCLGFFCNRVARVPKEELINVFSPEGLNDIFFKKDSIKKLLNDEYNNNTCDSLMAENDSTTVSDKDRETRVSKLFKEIGYKVKFVGSYKKRKEYKENDGY